MSYAHETCCAHLKIQYCKESLDGLTHDWWECASCKMLFAPQGRASLPQWIPISERLPTREDADERRIVRLENELLFKTTAAARAPAPERPRFVNLGADGKPTTGDHVAVWDRQSGLVHTAAPLLNGKDLNHADALRACAELELLGQKGWQLPYLMDLLSLIDYDRYDPAVDTAHFKGPFGWTWTRTPYKGNVSGASWIVYLYDGGASWYGHGGHDHVRAVLAGQF